MAKSKPIKGADIFDSKLFESATSQAQTFLKTIQDVKAGIFDLTKAEIELYKANPFKTSKDIENSLKSQSNLNVLTKQTIDLKKVEIDQEKKLTQQRILDEKLKQQQIKTQRDLNKESENAAKKAKDLNSVYKQASNELSNLSKRVKENSIAGREGSKTALLVAQAHDELRAKVDKADHAVGQFGRNVGNYAGDLKKLQKELQGLEPGTEQFNKLAAKAGDLKDKISYAKDAVKALGTDSKFTAFGNVFGQIKDDIFSLDFKRALEKSKLLADISKTITFAEAGKGIKDLGLSLLNTGKALLTNPLFLIGGAIAATVYAIYEYNKALQDNDEAIKLNSEYLSKNKEQVDELTKSLTKLSLQNKLINKEISKTEFEILSVRQETKEKAEDVERAFLENKKNLLKEYGLDELNALELFTKIGTEKYRNYNEKVVQEEISKNRLLTKIYQESTAKQKNIRDEAIVKEKDDNEKAAKEKAEQLKKHQEEELKKRIEFQLQLEKDIARVQEDIKEHEKKEHEERLKRIEEEKDAQFKKNQDVIDNRQKSAKEIEEEEKKEQLERLKRIRDLANYELDLLQNSLEQRSSLKQVQLDYEMRQTQDALETDRRLAEKGLANNLAFNEAQKAKQELELKKLKEKEIKQQKALIFMKALTAYLTSDPEHPDQALPKALIETAIAGVIAGGFYEGTENVEESLGKPVFSGKDGYVIRVDGKERIMTGLQNAMVGDMSNDDLANLAMLYNTGKLLPAYAMNMDMGRSSFSENISSSIALQQLYGINNRLQSLERTIANKTETSIQLTNLGDVIETKVKNNVRQVTRHLTNQHIGR